MTSDTATKPVKQPIYKRQQFLLALIQKLNGKTTATDLQKIVFMYTMKSGVTYYDFVPYKYGAYSFQLAQDIDVLCKDKYMTTENKLAEPKDYSPTIILNLSAIEKARSNALVRKAYEQYPYYAIRSEIVDKILDSTGLQAVHTINQQLTQDEQMLFSIGYEGKSIEAFTNILLKNGITLLCDVRRNPLSRKFGFSQSKLQHIIGSVGISYIHMPELGIESQERKSLETQEDYKALFAEYSRTLPSKTTALCKIYSLLQSNSRIALMCYEQDPDCCHRTIIKDYFVNSYHSKSEDL